MVSRGGIVLCEHDYICTTRIVVPKVKIREIQQKNTQRCRDLLHSLFMKCAYMYMYKDSHQTQHQTHTWEGCARTSTCQTTSFHPWWTPAETSHCQILCYGSHTRDPQRKERWNFSWHGCYIFTLIRLIYSSLSLLAHWSPSLGPALVRNRGIDASVFFVASSTILHAHAKIQPDPWPARARPQYGVGVLDALLDFA